MRRPSEEEIIRVRRWECETQGHQAEVVYLLARNDPTAVVCSRCGEVWAMARAPGADAPLNKTLSAQALGYRQIAVAFIRTDPTSPSGLRSFVDDVRRILFERSQEGA